MTNFFEVARTIANRVGAGDYAIHHISIDHTGNDLNRSYFHIENKSTFGTIRNEVNHVISQILNNPTYPRWFGGNDNFGDLMIIREFEDDIGTFIDQFGNPTPSNVGTLYFRIADLSHSLGELTTGHPTAPNRRKRKKKTVNYPSNIGGIERQVHYSSKIGGTTKKIKKQ